MKIAIAVHGRFHAFDLAKALIARGNDVTLLTNYPKWAVRRFGIPARYVRSMWPHGIAARAAWTLRERAHFSYPEAYLDDWFSQWAAEELNKESWDAVHCWSGVAEEVFLRIKDPRILKLMVRGSAHILAQSRLLEEEERRTGARLDRPSPWIVAREQREYKLADVIVLLSTFAMKSFIDEGVDPGKLHMLPLGVNVEAFRPTPDALQERLRRIRSGQKLRVLYVGALSFQKGLWDMDQIVRQGRGDFDFRFIGSITKECREMLAKMRQWAEFIPRQPYPEMGKWDAWGDLFPFPRIQNGFAAVLAQAQAASLPIITTKNSGGPDIISDGETGWVLPARDADGILNRLHWCASHRDELAAMVESSYREFHPRTWDMMAEDFEDVVRERRQWVAARLPRPSDSRQGLKIAIAVHGRFHAFQMAKALMDRGNQVTILTNYPKWAMKRFEIEPQYVRSLWPQGVASRATREMSELAHVPYPEARLSQWFGDWVASELGKEHWDAVHSWSGVTEEFFLPSKGNKDLRALMRGSSHIFTQARLLEDEEQRTGVRLDRPSPWIIAREQREYELADVITVLSGFCYQSFLDQGVDARKLCLLPLGVRVESFRPAEEVLQERLRRIRSGRPLRVLYVGAVSFRKGLWDLERIVKSTRPGEFEFRFVGPVLEESRKIVAGLAGRAEFVRKQPQESLWKWYAWGDVFLFPSIEEGLAVVLAQAQAACLPIITTANSGGPELIQEGETGWIRPIRNPEAFLERLEWCDTHREELAAMVEHGYQHFRPRTWAMMAEGFENLVRERRQPT